MAISFSRPDPSSPAAVGSAAFPVTKRGFDQGEVRDFLRMVAAELARLQEREKFLESEMRAMQTRGLSVPGRLDEETVTTLLGEEAARVLSTARDASVQIRERAEESATRLVKDAAEDAARIREAANIEASRIRDDAAHDAEAEIEMAKQQGRDMVNEAREYREKVLSELSRRRDAARAQIEQLLHGRDRLMNAFERARLASEDV
ncbi:MAG: DivIVA domain-containing protein, partial [Actinomycetota bacterium]